MNFSLPIPKQRQSLTLHIQESEEVEYRLSSTIRALKEIGNTAASEQKQTELELQKGYTASLEKQLAELNP